MKVNTAPLSGSFMIASIVGFLISAVYIYRNFSRSLALAFMIVFVAMFIASMVSMTYSTVDLPYDYKKR